MALSSDALTTVATVLDELDVADDGGAVRARVERYINLASAWAARICGRTFVYGAAVVERHRGMGTVRLHLGRPIVSITSIVVDGTTLDADSYLVEDATAGVVFREAGFPWTAQAQPGPSYHLVPGSEEPSIVVTYAGGWVSPAHATNVLPRTLPYDLEDAVVELVVSRWRRRGQDVRVRSSGFESSSYTFGGEPVPPEVMAALGPYMRIGSA